MTYKDAKSREETIDLIEFLISVLRRWRPLLISAIVGALLIGCVKGVLTPVQNGSEAEIKALQTSIDDNLALVKANKAEITTNNGKILANQEKIKTNEESLTSLSDAKLEFERLLVSLNSALDATQETFDNNPPVGEAMIDLNDQFRALKSDVYNTNQQITSIASQSRSIKNENTSLQGDITYMTARNETITNAIAELELELSDQEAEMQVLTGSSISVKSAVVYVIGGAVLGVFAFSFVALLQYVFYDKMRSAEELKRLYNIPILGECVTEQTEARGKYDRLLDRLRRAPQTVLDKQQVYELVAAGVLAADISTPVKLAVTGTVGASVLQEACDRISAQLPAGYTVIKADNPVYNAEFLANIRQYTVLLVEAKTVSDKREVDKLVETLCRNEVNVVGALVL